MRVLFAGYPEKTHFLAMAPLAWALRTAGHEVVFASQPSFAGVINQAGLTAVPVGRNSDHARMMQLDRRASASGRQGFPEPYDATEDTPAEALVEGYRHAVTWWHKMENLPLVADLVAFARAWRPDLVVWEPTTFAAPIAARASGAAHARLLFSLDIYGLTRRLFLGKAPAADPMAEWLGAYTPFGEDLVTGHFTIDQLPPSLTSHAPGLTYLPLRYTPYGGPATVPSWLRAKPARPRVALTLGLVTAEKFGGYPIDLPATLAELAELDVEVVATIPESHRPATAPKNVRFVEYVPLQPLAATCAAVIHHAGFGTLSTAARHALPHLIVPGDVDGPALARRLAEQGCAITVTGGESVGDRLRTLLETPSFRERAEALRAEIDAVPSPNDLVPALAELTARHRAA
ncbi:DUF1205 domain-containing protein [Herbidospora galbida]|uniref:DUF1205 domain-containing protein n=1 Tax=Herbidospora galbida TaxID=2575442 RepID=A0A4U3LST7_9ACTN|nr:nucleotide disphospho-sugar-binding domain-containing protein [Herbidospora galbida]TKK79065.1 DUF1205 domain-containing protein [Herbidospora galbida]